VRASLGSSVLLLLAAMGFAQVGSGRPQLFTIPNHAEAAQENTSVEAAPQAESELKKGTVLTRQGSFAEAIPHLLAAQGRVASQYAASFNLALCYVGTRQFGRAIETLENLRKEGHGSADVENLLAQSYVGSGQSSSAFEALQRASALTPTNEKLYMYVADACMEQRDYPLGIRVVDLGLTKLGESARLHYERGRFLSLLDEFDRAKDDFRMARTLAPGSEISYLAGAHEALYAGDPAEAARAAREGINKGFQSSTLLTILGEARMRAGVHPGEADFGEAQSALEKAVATQPRDANSRTSLGKLYLLANRKADAIVELEKARELSPENPAVYAPLAKAYQRNGDAQKAQEALARLTLLNQAQADKIASAPADRKAGYSGAEGKQSETVNHP